MPPFLQAPVLDPWAVAGPILKTLAPIAVILLMLAAVVGVIEGQMRCWRRR